MLLKFKLFEDPDYISEYNIEYEDMDALPFVLVKKDQTDGEVILGDFGKMHIDGNKKLKIGDLYDWTGYHGRLWMREKVISFWKYPPPEEMPDYIQKLKKELDKPYYKKYINEKLEINEYDIWDFDIELGYNDDEENSVNEGEIISLLNYCKLKEKPKDQPEEKRLMHVINPVEKEKISLKDRFPGWKPKKYKYQLPGESEVEARWRVNKYMYQEKNNPNKMIKQYNEFMCAHCGEDIELRIGQTYFVDGKRMTLHDIRDGRYIFVKGDDIVNVPEDKLDQYVSERKQYLKRWETIKNRK